MVELEEGCSSGDLSRLLCTIWSNARWTVEIKNFVLVINTLDF